MLLKQMRKKDLNGTLQCRCSAAAVEPPGQLGAGQYEGQGSNPDMGPVSRKSREFFGPKKPFVKVRPAYSVKLVFSYVVKGIKTKIIAKFRASRRLCFENTKRIMSPEIRPTSFGTFKKQAPGLKSLGPSFATA